MGKGGTRRDFLERKNVETFPTLNTFKKMFWYGQVLLGMMMLHYCPNIERVR
jgi:hypothetical protein